MKIKRQNLGFSLVETMVAATLGLLLLAGITEVYLSAKASYTLLLALTKIQQHGRMAIHLLNDNIRMAGLMTCGENIGFVSKDLIVQGYTSKDVPSYLQGQAVAGSDVVTIGQCRNIKGKQKFVSVSYFIGNTNRVTPAGSPVLALFEKRSGEGGQRQELVPDIQTMLIQYGVRDDAHIRYKSATEVSSWMNVRSVKIQLLLGSENNVFHKSHSYVFNGEAIHGRRLYREWDTYIALRERAH